MKVKVVDVAPGRLVNVAPPVRHTFGTITARKRFQKQQPGWLGPRLYLTRVMNIVGSQAADGCERGLKHIWGLAPRSDVLERPVLHDQDPQRTLSACRETGRADAFNPFREA